MGSPEYHPEYIKIKERVETATHEFYFQPDWELNLSIIDHINYKEEVGSVYGVVVLKRIATTKEEMVVLLCLDLIESMIKNCVVMAEYFGKSEVQSFLANMVSSVKSYKIRDKILDMVQFFGEGFKDRSDLSYYKLYAYYLTQPQIKFPPKRKETFIQPQKRRELETMYTQNQPSGEDQISLHKSSHTENLMLARDPYGVGIDITSSMYEQVSTKDNPKDHVRKGMAPAPSQPNPFQGKEKHVMDKVNAANGICDLFVDVLRQLVREGQQIKNNEVLNDLLVQLRDYHKKFLGYLEKSNVISNERSLDILLRINDRIVDTIKDHEKAIRGKLVVPKEVVVVKEEKKKKKKKSPERQTSESRRSESKKSETVGIANRKIEPIEMKNLTRLFSRQNLEPHQGRSNITLETQPTFNPEEMGVSNEDNNESKKNVKLKKKSRDGSKSSKKSVSTTPTQEIDLLTSFDAQKTSSEQSSLPHLQPQNVSLYPSNSNSTFEGFDTTSPTNSNSMVSTQSQSSMCSFQSQTSPLSTKSSTFNSSQQTSPLSTHPSIYSTQPQPSLSQNTSMYSPSQYSSSHQTSPLSTNSTSYSNKGSQIYVNPSQTNQGFSSQNTTPHDPKSTYPSDNPQSSTYIQFAPNTFQTSSSQGVVSSGNVFAEDMFQGSSFYSVQSQPSNSDPFFSNDSFGSTHQGFQTSQKGFSQSNGMSNNPFNSPPKTQSNGRNSHQSANNNPFL